MQNLPFSMGQKVAMHFAIKCVGLVFIHWTIPTFEHFCASHLHLLRSFLAYDLCWYQNFSFHHVYQRFCLISAIASDCLAMNASWFCLVPASKGGSKVESSLPCWFVNDWVGWPGSIEMQTYHEKLMFGTLNFQILSPCAISPSVKKIVVCLVLLLTFPTFLLILLLNFFRGV